MTILYTAAGVALSTISIEILAGYMRKIHYIGRRVKLRNAVLFFEDKAFTLGRIFELLGKKYSLSRPQVNRLIEGLEEIAIKCAHGLQVEPDASRLVLTDHHGYMMMCNDQLNHLTMNGSISVPVNDNNNEVNSKDDFKAMAVQFDTDGDIVEKYNIGKFVRCLSRELRRLKGAFTYSGEDIRYIDDDRISSIV